MKSKVFGGDTISVNKISTQQKDLLEKQNIQKKENTNLYDKLSYISLFRNIHYLLNIKELISPNKEERKEKYLFIFNIIENHIKDLDNQFNLNLKYDSWFENYIRSHFGYNIVFYLKSKIYQPQYQTDNEEDLDVNYYFSNKDKNNNIKDDDNKYNEELLINAINEVKNDLVNIFSNSHQLPDIVNQFINNNTSNKKLFQRTEVIKLSNMIDAIKLRYLNNYSNQEVSVIKIENIINLFYQDKLMINKILINMVFKKAKELYEKDEYHQSDIVNEKNSFYLYKSYYYAIYQYLFREYEKAIQKTLDYYLSISNNEKIIFEEKFKNGIPIKKFEKSLDEYMDFINELTSNIIDK